MRLPRMLVLLAIAITASACGGVEYRDTSAAVDANPLCASVPSQPGEPVSQECERKSEVSWKTRQESDGKPLDLSGKRGD